MAKEFMLPREVNELISDVFQDETVKESVSRISSHYRCCENCGKEADKKCAGCQAVLYCGSECQNNDWKAHKVECKLIKEEAKWDDKDVTEEIVRRHLSRHHHDNIFHSIASEVPELEEFDVEEAIKKAKELSIKERKEIGIRSWSGKSGTGLPGWSNRGRAGRGASRPFVRRPSFVPHRGRYGMRRGYFPRRRLGSRGRRYLPYAGAVAAGLLNSLMRYGVIDPYYYATYPAYADKVRRYRTRQGLAPYALPPG